MKNFIKKLGVAILPLAAVAVSTAAEPEARKLDPIYEKAYRFRLADASKDQKMVLKTDFNIREDGDRIEAFTEYGGLTLALKCFFQLKNEMKKGSRIVAEPKIDGQGFSRELMVKGVSETIEVAESRITDLSYHFGTKDYVNAYSTTFPVRYKLTIELEDVFMNRIGNKNGITSLVCETANLPEAFDKTRPPSFIKVKGKLEDEAGKKAEALKQIRDALRTDAKILEYFEVISPEQQTRKIAPEKTRLVNGDEDTADKAAF